MRATYAAKAAWLYTVPPMYARLVREYQKIVLGIPVKMARNEVLLKLYKNLMRESQKFGSYNIRHYALRRIRDAFKESKTLTNSEAIKKQIEYGNSSLDLVKRQVIIQNMYQSSKLIIEKQTL